MPGSQSKEKRFVRGGAETMSVLSYQPYEQLVNTSQTENPCGCMDEGLRTSIRKWVAAIHMMEVMKRGSFCPRIAKKSLSH